MDNENIAQEQAHDTSTDPIQLGINFNELYEKEVGKPVDKQVDDEQNAEDGVSDSPAIDLSEEQKSFVELLQEGNIIDPDEVEEVVNAEDLPSYLGSKFVNKVEEAVNTKMEAYPEVVREIVKAHETGADVDKYLESYVQQRQAIASLDSIDINNVETQRAIMYNYYKSQGLNEEQTELTLRGHEENKTLDIFARNQYGAIKQSVQQQIEKERAESEAMQAQREENNKAYMSAVSQHIDAGTAAGIDLGKDKAGLRSYISVANQMLNDGRACTRFEADMNDAFADPEKYVALAKFLRDGFTATRVAKPTTSVKKKSFNHYFKKQK